MEIYMPYEYMVDIPVLSDFQMTYYCRFKKDIYDPRIFPPHAHDHLEFYVLIEGDASFMVENQLYQLRTGDIVINRPNHMHHCVLNNRSVHQHLCLWFNPAARRFLSEFLDTDEKTVISPSDEDKSALLSLYYELEAAGQQSNERRQLAIGFEILDIYARSLKCSETRQAQLQAIPPLLQDIINDINENFVQIHSLDYFTEKYFISMSTLNRLFKKHLHTSPKLYLESKRLTHSRLLLKEGKSVLSACTDSGFPDYSNYIRLFKSRFGITPKQYKDSK